MWVAVAVQLWDSEIKIISGELVGVGVLIMLIIRLMNFIGS
jgi:hypothetical protein